MSNAREIKQIKAGHQAGRRDAGPFALGVTILEQIPGALIGTLNGPEELRNWVSRLTSLGCLGGARTKLHGCSLRPGWLPCCKLGIIFFPGAIFRERPDSIPVGFVLLQFVVTHHEFRWRIAFAEALPWDRTFK